MHDEDYPGRSEAGRADGPDVGYDGGAECTGAGHGAATSQATGRRG